MKDAPGRAYGVIGRAPEPRAWYETMRYGSVRDKSTEGCYLDMLYIVSVLVLFVMQVGIFEKVRGIARITPEISFNRIIRVPHPGDNIIEVLQIYAYNHKLNIDPAYSIINFQTRLHCSLARHCN